MTVVELLSADDGANNDSNESFFVCVVGWFDGFVENISSRLFVRDAAGLFELLLNRDSNGSADGLTVVVVVGCSIKNLNYCEYRLV